MGVCFQFSPVKRCSNGGIGRHEGLKILWPVMAVRVQVPLRVRETESQFAETPSFLLKPRINPILLIDPLKRIVTLTNSGVNSILTTNTTDYTNFVRATLVPIRMARASPYINNNESATPTRSISVGCDTDAG